MAELGELSSARLASNGASCAPRNEKTLRALRDPHRRLVALREHLPEEVRFHQPLVPFELDHEEVLQNLRSARRDAAPGPSGMTSEHSRPLLEHDGDGVLLCELAEQFARASVPKEIVEALHVERLFALQKPSGGVRRIVVDTFRRLVARTMAKQLRVSVEEATVPFQHADQIGWGMCGACGASADGGGSVEHVLSTDRVGAFDLVSRMSGLLRMEGGGAVLPQRKVVRVSGRYLRSCEAGELGSCMHPHPSRKNAVQEPEESSHRMPKDLRGCHGLRPRICGLEGRCNSSNRGLGHWDFVEASLQAKSRKHDTFFDRLVATPDLQYAWVLLLSLRIDQGELRVAGGAP